MRVAAGVFGAAAVRRTGLAACPILGAAAQHGCILLTRLLLRPLFSIAGLFHILSILLPRPSALGSFPRPGLGRAVARPPPAAVKQPRAPLSLLRASPPPVRRQSPADPAPARLQGRLPRPLWPLLPPLAPAATAAAAAAVAAAACRPSAACWRWPLARLAHPRRVPLHTHGASARGLITSPSEAARPPFCHARPAGPLPRRDGPRRPRPECNTRKERAR